APLSTVRTTICEVWAYNLDEEVKKIRQVLRKYNYVAMSFRRLGKTR
uniref:Uncharacterized protein n=1 Tax=Catharus ustulatus TaxID=91951 RepID=A0A8C3VC72_CATUS